MANLTDVRNALTAGKIHAARDLLAEIELESLAEEDFWDALSLGEVIENLRAAEEEVSRDRA